MYELIHQCPVCDHSLHITRLQCARCDTTIENEFQFSTFSSFTKEQLHFIQVFLINRGNIKGVEKSLGISYPTVRMKLEEIIKHFGSKQEDMTNVHPESELQKDHHKEVISKLEAGEITADEAIKQFKNKGDVKNDS